MYQEHEITGKVTLNTQFEKTERITRYPLASSTEEANDKFKAYCEEQYGDLLKSIEVEHVRVIEH